jgi:hypothetical protein
MLGKRGKLCMGSVRCCLEFGGVEVDLEGLPIINKSDKNKDRVWGDIIG